MTCEAWLYQWVALRSGGLRPRTVESYTDLIRLHIAPAIGSKSLRKLKPRHISEMLAAIMADGHSRTAQLCYVLLRAALRAAVVSQRLDRSPVESVLRPAHKPRPGRAWSMDEARAYVRAINAHKHQLAWYLAICLGLRRGEICGLKWSDIDLHQRVIHISRQRIRLKDGRIVEAPPKSDAGIRDLPIPAALLFVIRRNWQWGDAYFVPLTPSGLDAAHRATLRRLELPYIRLHDLRHTMASNAVRNGASMRALADVLGHSDPAMTARVYAHPDATMLAATIDAAISAVL